MTEYLVEPKSRKDIRVWANLLRKSLKIDGLLYVPVVQLLDILSEVFTDSFSYEIVPDSDLAEETHADTDILTGHIRIKESVYERACEGEGRDRMTIAHEIPCIQPEDSVPEKLILFSKALKCDDADCWVCFYEDDVSFGIVP